MINVRALRTSLLCAIGVVALAGCGAVHTSGTTLPVAPGAASSTGVTASPPNATPTATTPTTPNTSGINRLISGIDNQLSTIDGQLNAANAGLSTSEGDPSQ